MFSRPDKVGLGHEQQRDFKNLLQVALDYGEIRDFLRRELAKYLLMMCRYFHS